MKKPDIPRDEEARLNTLRSLNILDTPSEERLDCLTRIAKRQFGVPIALVSLVDEDRQWFKSCLGLSVRETPRDISFCGHSILNNEILVIPDTTKDERFADNPLVTNEPKIRFYAGCPLEFMDGSRLGTLCIIDQQPRNLSDDNLKTLKDLASIAERELAIETTSRAKSEFLAHMSHELRTPLNAILGFTQLMSRDSLLNSSHLENLEIINRSGQHLLELINDILDISKIEAGKIQLQENSFSLDSLLDDLGVIFGLKAEYRGLTLRLNIEDEIPQYIEADEKKLRQVLINLLGNAIKFTESGRVILSVRVNTVEKTPTLFFDVSDTGVGIAPSDIDGLFKAFSQATGSSKFQEGTGLGLTISRNFVELMGGYMTVNSLVGTGTSFKFAIPFKKVSEHEFQVVQPKRRVLGLAPNQPKYRILVVEDKLANRKLLSKLIESIGFEIREAVNGEEAIALCQSWSPQLIWMDMRMPVMDGNEATQRIRATKEGEDTVIIALTASVPSEQKGEVLKAGCDDFVRKPFQEEEIFSKMAQYLDIEYIYEELSQITQPNSYPLSQPEILLSESLAIMPEEWIEKLYQAATKLNGKEIIELTEQIPEKNILLGKALTDLVDKIRFDTIVELYKTTTKE